MGGHLQGLTPKTEPRGGQGTLPQQAGGSRGDALGPAWGSPSVQCPASTVGASGMVWDPRAGLSSPQRQLHTPDGIWGPGEKRNIRGCTEHPKTPPQDIPKAPLPPLSGSLCQRAKGNTRPGPSRAALWGHNHQCPLQLQGHSMEMGPSAVLSSSSPHTGVPHSDLTIRSPQDSEEHQGSHEDVEQREPPAEEQQVKDIATRQRGPCRREGTSWDHCHLQLPPASLVPKATPPPEPRMTLRSE